MEPESKLEREGGSPPIEGTTEDMLANLVTKQARVIAALRAEIEALRERLKKYEAA